MLRGRLPDAPLWVLDEIHKPARFENLVASHLLKWVHHEQDVKGRDLDLRYFRDVQGREVDFVVVEGRKPVLLVEAKGGDADLGPSVRYLRERTGRPEAWQVSATNTILRARSRSTWGTRYRTGTAEGTEAVRTGREKRRALSCAHVNPPARQARPSRSLTCRR